MFDINCTLKSSKKNDSTILSIKGVVRDIDVLDNMTNPVCLSIGDQKIVVNGNDLITAVSHCMDNGQYPYQYRGNRMKHVSEEE